MPGKTMVLATVGVLALGAAGVIAYATGQSDAPDFTSGGKVMTHEEITRKMQSEGFSDVQVQQQGTNLVVSGLENGMTQSMTMDAKTGRSVSDDGDDD